MMSCWGIFLRISVSENDLPVQLIQPLPHSMTKNKYNLLNLRSKFICIYIGSFSVYDSKNSTNKFASNIV